MHGHEEWLRIAKEDLAVAKALLKLDFFGTVTYHCQQSAEKALKGYLAFKNHAILKTHDLIKLNKLCFEFDRSFEKISVNAEQLNPFATKFRYPSEFDIPDVTDAQLTIKHAEDIMHFVLQKVSKSDTGQTDIFADPDKK